jgi:hypothetical protein
LKILIGERDQLLYKIEGLPEAIKYYVENFGSPLNSPNGDFKIPSCYYRIE